jgi:hypothetical protein
MTVKFSIAKVLALASAFVLLQLVIPNPAKAQGLEVSGSYAHATSDFGVDGFDLGAGWFFSPQLSVAAEYDGMWDTSRVGTFEFTTVGAIVSQSHLQDFLIGPRYYFSSQKVGKNGKRLLMPFAEAQFGVSHLNQSIQEGIAPAVSASDSAFSWMLGGGVDYSLGPHWVARGSLDLLRTHLNADAQSRLRIGIGIAYTFGTRSPRDLTPAK